MFYAMSALFWAREVGCLEEWLPYTATIIDRLHCTTTVDTQYLSVCNDYEEHTRLLHKAHIPYTHHAHNQPSTYIGSV